MTHLHQRLSWRQALRACGAVAAVWAVARLMPGSVEPAHAAPWLEDWASTLGPLVSWALAWVCAQPRRHASALDIEAVAWSQLPSTADDSPASRRKTGR